MSGAFPVHRFSVLLLVRVIFHLPHLLSHINNRDLELLLKIDQTMHLLASNHRQLDIFTNTLYSYMIATYFVFSILSYTFEESLIRVFVGYYIWLSRSLLWSVVYTVFLASICWWCICSVVLFASVIQLFYIMAIWPSNSLSWLIWWFRCFIVFSRFVLYTRVFSMRDVIWTESTFK